MKIRRLALVACVLLACSLRGDSNRPTANQLSTKRPDGGATLSLQQMITSNFQDQDVTAGDFWLLSGK